MICRSRGPRPPRSEAFGRRPGDVTRFKWYRVRSEAGLVTRKDVHSVRVPSEFPAAGFNDWPGARGGPGDRGATGQGGEREQDQRKAVGNREGRGRQQKERGIGFGERKTGKERGGQQGKADEGGS
eukprot:752060-Hanusia_phi.AAC.4